MPSIAPAARNGRAKASGGDGVVSAPPAVARLLDDASQFPPGNLPLEEAWPAHRRWRSDVRAAIVGRFLLPSGRVAALAELIGDGGGDGAELGIVVTPGDGPEVLEPLQDATRVSAIELRPEAAADARAWRDRAPAADVFLEGVPVEEISSLRAGDPHIAAKLRCGGLSPEAFPSPEAVATFVQACVRLDVPFKATAGLHGAFRHWDPEIGVYHHGFMNIWTATALAAEDVYVPELVGCLLVQSADELREFPVGLDELARARRWFTAFGTCNIDEPLEGLAAVGLLDG
jgi:hypothetical protein